MPDKGRLVLKLEEHQPYLSEVANRLLVLAQTLRRDYSVPEALAEELVTASSRCAHAYSHLECVLESLNFFREGLDNGLARLRREIPGCDEAARLRADAQGAYAWDRWQEEALGAGISAPLATLGRALMREAVQHDWNARLKAECGWLDGGQAMLALALTDAPAAEERWRYLLATDGGRGRWTADGEWESFGEDLRW